MLRGTQQPPRQAKPAWKARENERRREARAVERAEKRLREATPLLTPAGDLAGYVVVRPGHRIEVF